MKSLSCFPIWVIVFYRLIVLDSYDINTISKTDIQFYRLELEALDKELSKNTSVVRRFIKGFIRRWIAAELKRLKIVEDLNVLTIGSLPN